jgi:L-rhamnose isomerase
MPVLNLYSALKSCNTVSEHLCRGIVSFQAFFSTRSWSSFLSVLNVPVKKTMLQVSGVKWDLDHLVLLKWKYNEVIYVA